MAATTRIDATSRRQRCLLALSVALAVVCSPAIADTDADTDTHAKIYPVEAIFWDKNDKVIDQEFMQSQDIPALSKQIREELNAAFVGRTSPLNGDPGADTYAVSFQLTRMTAYEAGKANGNTEIRTPVTGSIYFTNILSGAILLTVPGTNAAVVTLSPSDLAGAGHRTEIEKLYTASLHALITQLCKTASAKFQPRIIDAIVAEEKNQRFVLSGGYLQGIQLGDDLSDDRDNLIQVSYVGPDYAVATGKLVRSPTPAGTHFHKTIVGEIPGRDQKSATVLVDDKLPQGISPGYVAQLFTEELGGKSPLAVVQVNTNFKDLLDSIRKAAEVGTENAANRPAPDLVVLLHVSDPIMFEQTTNLQFKTIRGFAAYAYAEIVDTTGRVLFTASGHDLQQIEVTNGLDLDRNARREIAVKNALLALAAEVAKLADVQYESAAVTRIGSDGLYIAKPGKALSDGNGYLLRQAEVQLNGKKRKILLPRILSMTPNEQAAAVGDTFQIWKLGTTPRSSTRFTLCPAPESLGNLPTPSFEWMASNAIGNAMPGNYYLPTIKTQADAMIKPINGFGSVISWNIPSPPLCLQPVQRVNVGNTQCTKQCQVQITAGYSIRAKTGDTVATKYGLEWNFRTTGFQKSTQDDQVTLMIAADLVDEARLHLPDIAGKLDLTPFN